MAGCRKRRRVSAWNLCTGDKSDKVLLLLQKLIMQTFSMPQILSLLSAARKESENDWLMILVTFCHALRASEVIDLKPRNVSSGTLIVKRLKGSAKTEQSLFSHDNPLLSERESLIELCLEKDSNQKLFPISRATFWRRMQKYCKTAGLPIHLAHPHILKHSILSQMIANANISEVQAWGGHKSMASTGKYLHPTPEKVAEAARRTLG